MSASLPSTVRLNGEVTTESGLAWKTPYAWAGLRPVQVVVTTLPLLSPLSGAGEVSEPVAD